MEIRMVHLWADAMNRNGSRGNLLCLRRRLEWRGIAVTVREIPVGESVELGECDLLYLGAGTPYENEALRTALYAAAPALREYVARCGVFLAVCEGFELMGESITLEDGSTLAGAGAVPFTTRRTSARSASQLLFLRHGETMAAFENHGSRIELPSGQQPLGTLLSGRGNGTADGAVGIQYRGFYGCSAYSLLPLNPMLTDEILSSALERRCGDAGLAAMDDSLENMARQRLLRRVDKEA